MCHCEPAKGIVCGYHRDQRRKDLETAHLISEIIKVWGKVS